MHEKFYVKNTTSGGCKCAPSASFCYRFRYIFSHLSYYGIVAVRKVALPKI